MHGWRSERGASAPGGADVRGGRGRRVRSARGGRGSWQLHQQYLLSHIVAVLSTERIEGLCFGVRDGVLHGHGHHGAT